MTREEKSSVLDHEPFTFEQMKEIEAMHLQHDWDVLRNQAAIAAMQSFIGKFNINIRDSADCEKITKLAVEQADALIKELKKK